MSPSTTTRTWGRVVPVRSSSRRVLVGILLVVIAIAAVALAQAMPAPAKSHDITIDNPSDYAVTVEASGPGPDGWVGIAVVPAQGSAVASEVIDQGSTWSLRFTSQARRFEDFEVTRQQLADNDWHYALPADISDQLTEAGVPPSP